MTWILWQKPRLSAGHSATDDRHWQTRSPAPFREQGVVSLSPVRKSVVWGSLWSLDANHELEGQDEA